MPRNRALGSVLIERTWRRNIDSRCATMTRGLGIYEHSDWLTQSLIAAATRPGKEVFPAGDRTT